MQRRMTARPSPRGRLAPVGCEVSALSAFFLFWMVFSKVLPPTSNWLIEWMRNDKYFCLLVPLVAVPVSLFANYIRWFTLSLASGAPVKTYVPSTGGGSSRNNMSISRRDG